MKKLKLEAEDLRVESFPTAEGEAEEGTVHAHATRFQTGGCWSCDARCIETAPETCDNSLDYCTCACTDDWRCHPPISDAGSCPCQTEPV
ncbi:MAG TPA: hypothetical protein VF746_00065 [Longimicrobium sp.]|jgi:hypothetical protein